MGKLSQLATVKSFLGVTDNNSDALINNLIDRVSARIETYCSRTLGSATYMDEIYDGDGLSRSLFLRQWPVISVSSLYDDINRSWGSDSLIASADYVVHNDWGEIKLIKNSSLWAPSLEPKFGKGVGNIKVTYTAGYLLPGGSGSGSALPADIEGACNDLVYMDYFGRGLSGPEGLRSFVQDIPEKIQRILDRYKRHPI